MTAVVLPPIKNSTTYKSFLAWQCIRQKSCPVSACSWANALRCSWGCTSRCSSSASAPVQPVSGWKGPKMPPPHLTWHHAFGHKWDNGTNLLAYERSWARWEGHENVQIAMSEKQHNIHIASLVLGIATMHSFLLSLEPLRPVMNGVPVIGNVPFKRMFPLLCFPP